MGSEAKYWIGVAMLVLGMATVVGMALEGWQWRAGRRLGNRRHLGLRLFNGLLLLSILGMIFVGVVWLPLQNPLHAFLYWTLCLLLVFALMVLALVDWRWVMERQVEQEWHITRQMLRQSLERERPQTSQGNHGSGSSG